MLVTPDLGKERWKIVQNLFECFLGTRPIGETWKFGVDQIDLGGEQLPDQTCHLFLADGLLHQHLRP